MTKRATPRPNMQQSPPVAEPVKFNQPPSPNPNEPKILNFFSDVLAASGKATAIQEALEAIVSYAVDLGWAEAVARVAVDLWLMQFSMSHLMTGTGVPSTVFQAPGKTPLQRVENVIVPEAAQQPSN